MALADVQTVWTNKMKPYIVAGFLAMVAGTHAEAKYLVLADGSHISQSTFQAAGNYIVALGSTDTGHDNLLLADGTNIAQSTFIPASEKAANNGVATLGADGKVPASQLPSYVDDVIEGYYKAADGKFYEEDTYTTEITPEGGKIYVDLTSSKTYRWGGSAYAVISDTLALGETQGTAYEGSKGAANAAAIAALQSDKANKSEMAIEAVAGDATKKEITLKSGLSQEVVIAHQDISGKADIVSGGVENNFFAIDSNGNLKDSGKKSGDFATAAQGTKADSAIQTVKVNGTALTPDANNAVDVTFEIPERVSSEDLDTFVA